MTRRRFLKTALLGAAVAGGAGGLVWYKSGEPAVVLGIDAALAKIDWLAKQKLGHTGAWNPQQIFSHCAQTVEYSMLGYPAPKSPLFQDTVGKLAFTVFSSRQKMMHGLGEPIAGAPILDALPSPETGLARLRLALLQFQQFQGKLAPHFAYGALSKEEYALAHVLHFSNHLDEIKVL